MALDAARNPFANLGLKRGRGRKDVQPPDQAKVAEMLAAADELTPPSFAAYLLTACWSAALPGELDALQWDDVDFRARDHPNQPAMQRQGGQAEDAEARLAPHGCVARTRGRMLAVAAARERMGVHDASRDALHAVVAHVPLEPRPMHPRHGRCVAL